MVRPVDEALSYLDPRRGARVLQDAPRRRLRRLQLVQGPDDRDPGHGRPSTQAPTREAQRLPAVHDEQRAEILRPGKFPRQKLSFETGN